MCGGGGGQSYNPPPPPAPPAAAPRPMASPETDAKGNGDSTQAGGFYKKRGKDALKIDLASGGSGSATGLNIPS